jgi:predicted AlkP superfamily phosphohydrolase/phosphomutase
MSRVAAMALDAADVHMIQHLIDRGELPFLRALRARSARYGLRSDTLYRGTLIWEAFLAGREDVGDRAGSGFAFDPASYASFQVGTLGTKPFYERAPGIAPIALDVPHLSASGSGVRVCCWGGHALSSVRGSVPRGLLLEIEERFGGHSAFRADHVYAWHRREYVDSLGDALAEGARRRIEITAWLQQRFRDWNLILVAMSEAHSAGENFGHTLDEAHPLAGTPTAALAWQRLVDVYRALDDAVGRFTATLPQDTGLVVFALHGMTINDADLPSQVLLPELLYRVQHGRSRLRDVDLQKWRRAGCPPVVPKSATTWKQHMDSRWRGARPGRRGFQRLARQLLPNAVLDARQRHSEHRSRAVSGESADTNETDHGLRKLDGSVPSWYRESWPELGAFALPTFSDARVRINLQGRERDGVVPLDEYERFCSQVEAWVRSSCDARTGRPAVEDVCSIGADDPRDPESPDADLIVRWAPGVDAIVHPDVGTIGPYPFRRTGGHTPHGFAWVSGPGIEPGEHGERLAQDVPPTILTLLGQSVPHDIHGTPLLSRSH